MIDFQNFHFLRPAWLWLLPVVVWVWWLVRAQQDPLRGWRAWMDSTLLAAMSVGDRGAVVSNTDTDGNQFARTGGFWRGCRLLAGMLIGVLAVAGPTWQPERSPFADDPVPVMLVLYAGESMRLADMAPNRMERARLKVADFAAERPGLPLGLIAYAGSAHLVLPPTRDTLVVASMANEISPDIMPAPGDDLAAALKLAAKTLEKSGGSIVVVSDTVAKDQLLDLRAVSEVHPSSVHFLAVARRKTSEWNSVNAAAMALGADVTLMTPDLTDIQDLVRRVAKTPVAVAAAAEGIRWEEAGWWLVPLLAILALGSFRRIRDETSLDTAHESPQPHALDTKTVRGDGV